MGALFGIAGGVVLLLLVAVLWTTGAFRPKEQDRSGPSGLAEKTAPAERIGNLD